jgi:hypothetical protein
MWIRTIAFQNGRKRLFLAAALFGLATQSRAQSQSSSLVASHKDPKLSTVIAEIRSMFTQESRQGALGGATVKETLSKLPVEVREALHSRMLRLNSLGSIQVDIGIQGDDTKSLAELAANGFSLQTIAKPYPNKVLGEVFAPACIVEGWLPPNAIARVEALPFVQYIKMPSYGVNNSTSIDTQGDHILQADLSRSTLNIDGTGVTVGVISSGIAGIFANDCTSGCPPTANVPSPITLGDLPPAVGMRNANGTLIAVSGGITAMSFRSDDDLEDTADGSGGAEGTAMLEIVHDLAPGASLNFANAETSLQFEQAVNALASTSDVVVDDVSWFTPPFDGTSAVSTNTADALNNNAYPIRAYFTAAGNWAQDHYQGLYSDSLVDGYPYTGEAGDLHLFEGSPSSVMAPPGATTDNGSFGNIPFDPLIAVPAGQSISVYLAWNDPELASTNDYDVFLVPLTCAGIASQLPQPPCTIAGPALVKGMDPQTGVQNPAEQLSWTNGTSSTATVGIVIQNVGNMAQARTFDMFINGYGAKQRTPNHNFNTESGSITAEADAGGGVMTIGAINQDQCIEPESCTGLLEAYSSQGPTEMTPQSVNGTIKPNLVAVDQVCVDGAGGFNSTRFASGCPPSQPTTYTPVLFGGTSAAAPHVAAIAALVLEAAPCLLANNQVGLPSTARSNLSNAVTKNAHPLSGYFESLPNPLEGFGLVDALDSAMSMVTTANVISAITVSATNSNGASVALSPTWTDPNSCPAVSVTWTGGCGTGTAQGSHATVQCPIGTNTIQVALSNNGKSYQPATQVPYSTIIVTDFVVGASPSTMNVAPGQTLLYTVTAQSTPQGQFANPIALACSSGLPAGATCSFSSATLTAANSAGTSTSTSNSTLTIYTSGLAQLKPDFNDRPSDKAPTEYVACFLAIVLCVKVRRAKLIQSKLALLLTVILFAPALGCGTHNNSPAPVTYTVTITGTSNQLVRTTTVSFTVQ